LRREERIPSTRRRQAPKRSLISITEKRMITITSKAIDTMTKKKKKGIFLP
jgi:hypothetical protein